MLSGSVKTNIVGWMVLSKYLKRNNQVRKKEKSKREINQESARSKTNERRKQSCNKERKKTTKKRGKQQRKEENSK